MIKFGDCTLSEFTVMCDRRGIHGVDREIWIKLFKRCANAPGKQTAMKRQRRIISDFIEEGRKLSETGAIIVMPKTKPASKLKPKSKQKR